MFDSIIKNLISETKIASFYRGLFKFVGGILTTVGVSEANASSFTEAAVLVAAGITSHLIGQFFSNKAKAE